MEEKNTKKKPFSEKVGPGNTTFTCFMPKELHKMIKIHAAIRNETINNWMVRCIVEQLQREKTLL